VSAVDTELVMRVLKPIWLEKPVAAARTRGRIEMVLDWATAMGYRAGDNPARFSGHLDHLLPDQTRGVRHHTAMSHADVPGFIQKLDAFDGIASPALQFVIFTAVRVSEALGATWDEIDGRTWIVPAGRMKRNREHRVPLSDAAMAVVNRQRLIRHSDYIFPGRHGMLAPNTLLVLARQCGATTHGFRSSFRDWAAECTDTPREIAELALSHSVGTAVERAYARSTLFEKRRELMEAWGRYCIGATVMPLRASA
jgi:integrase